MDRREKALRFFSGNFNCAQSVLSSFALSLGLSLEQAWRIATPFGGGLAHTGDVCGAVSGALMVIGLKYGMKSEEDVEAKERVYALSQTFMRQFRERNGTITCRELIDCDLSTPEGYETAKQKGLFDTVCTKLVRDAVGILEEILEQQKT